MTAYSENGLFNLVRATFEAPAYAVLRHVSDATGSQRGRTVDAMAMGVWPSRGLDLHGFEIKSERRDWLRELKDPAKAEPLARFCDRWWLVVADEDMVKGAELPETWGLLAPDKKGEKLRRVKEAAKLEPVPITRAFLAALLRRVNEQAPEKAELAAEYERGRKDGLKHGQEYAGTDAKRLQMEIDYLRKSIAAFEKTSGLSLNEYNGERIGEAAKIVHAILANRRQLDYPLSNLRRIVADVASRAEELDAALDAIAKPAKEEPNAA